MTGRVTTLLLLAVALLAAGCALAPDDAPRDIAVDERSLEPAGVAGAADATGTSRIFLVAPSEPGRQRRLRSVQRDVVNQPAPLISVLLDGPNQDEIDERLVTAIPTGTTLVATRLVGDILFVDVSAEITELTGDALVLAVAQIVFTATQIDGVDAVRLQVQGEDQAWPVGDGQTQTRSLRVYDYPGLVESAQPAYPAIPAAG